jgi:hypothetical protein
MKESNTMSDTMNDTNNAGTEVARVELNNKIGLRVLHKVTDKGDSFTYQRTDNGLKLPPVGSIAKILDEGNFGGEPFVSKAVKERFDGKLVETNVKYAQSTVVLSVDGRDLSLSLEFRPDDLGRFVPSLKGRFLSGGQRGRVASVPVDEDELF